MNKTLSKIRDQGHGHRALENNIKKFETTHGPIKVPGDGDEKNIGFQSPRG